jgi:uncharacterized protein (TIGR02996 family)
LSTAQDFLDAIVASPDDDTPRLAYADWLDEHGDAARAEFIRTQIALARPGEDDQRRAALKAREQQLQEENADTWLGDRGKGVIAYRFNRGLLEEIDLGEERLWERAVDLFQTWPIRELWLGVCSTEGVRRLASSAWLSRLTRLNLVSDHGQAGTKFAILFDSPHLANLQELSLCGSHGGPECVTALVRSGVTRLRALSLIGEDIGVAGAGALASWAGLAGISHLNLRQNDLGQTGVEALLAGRPARLVSLDVTHNNVPASGARAIARAEFLSRLEKLNLGNNPLGNDGVAEVTRSSHLRPRALDLRVVSCDRSAARGIACSPIAEHLRRLDLSFNSLGSEGAAALARSPRFAGLTDLELSHCGIGLEGVRALAESPHLKCLKSLVLSGNDIGPRGIEALTRSPNCGALRELDLDDAGLDDRAAEVLAEWPGLAGLNCLGLCNNNIGDDGARTLAASPYVAGIERLYMFGENLRQEGLEALRAAGLKHVN